MNIAEILKDCPKGIKLYSPLFGECELNYVDYNPNIPYPIIIIVRDNNFCFTKDGLFYIDQPNGECILFPSKENRDWSTFKIPKKEYEFKPFYKVLVRDNNQSWHCDIFSHYNNNNNNNNNNDENFVCVGGIWQECIPYESNEHLLGTTDNPR